MAETNEFKSEETTFLIQSVDSLDSDNVDDQQMENFECLTMLTEDNSEENEDNNEENHELKFLTGAKTTTFRAITLMDGTQAYVTNDFPIDDDDLEEHTLQLADGNTVVLQEIPSFFQGQPIRLKDGTTAFLSTADDEETYQAVQLEDGFTACIVTPTAVLEPLELDSLSVLAQERQEDETSNDTQQAATVTETSVNQNSCSTDYANLKDRSGRSFMCPQPGCGKYYTTYHHLKVHERSHTGDRPFRCPEKGCEKAFATCYARKAHVRTHTGEKPYKCPEKTCSKSFKTSGDLQKHIRTHTGERPFRCPMPDCGRSFTTSNIRKVHIRTHTGERPYECPEEGCDRAFASATNYKNHLRIHSGEKPYCCSVQGCGKRFTEYSSLYKHQIVHTQQKPYSCPICARNYRQASTLTMHKKTVHGIVETDDGTEIILGKMVFTLAANNSAPKLKNLNSNVLEFNNNGSATLTLDTQSNNSDDSEQGTSQYLVVDPAQLAALEFGVSTESSEELELDSEKKTESISE